MARLFIAMPVDDDAISSLQNAGNELKEENSILKVVSPKNYHITLKFFGNCEEHISQSIEKSFSEIAIHSGEIPFTLHGLGTFPNINRASVVWCGLKTDIKAIGKIFNTIEEFSSGHGFKPENRNFIPHLTLARVRKKQKLNNNLISYIENNRETLLGSSAFKKIVLYSSKLTPDGPVYTELKAIFLK